MNAADILEAIRALRDDGTHAMDATDAISLIEGLVLEEREACAKVAEDVYHWGNQCALQVAEGIRARSNNSN